MSSVRFLCQRCSQPLKLSPSAELPGTATVQEEPGEALEDGGPSTKRADGGELEARVSGGPLPDGGTMCKDSASHFTLLGDVLSVRTLNSTQKTTVDIFDILSGQKAVDHPLCVECTDHLLWQLDVRLALAEQDSQDYRRGLDTMPLMGEEEQEALRAELRGLEAEEARLARELEDVDQNRARVAALLRAAQAETAELRQRETQHGRDCCALQWQQLELEDQLGSVDTRLSYAQAQLWRLQRLSIFDAAFTIWEDGPVGVINNFRLGRLPQVPVAWGEINAAWGQTALLLLALANMVGLRFQRYQPVACGNRSYLMALTGDRGKLPLFSDGTHSVFLNNKFDQAMVAFLDCLQQFKDEAEKGESGLRLAYAIRADLGAVQDAAGGGSCCPIRTHLNTEEEWTRALRLMLANLKCSLDWASSRYRRK